MTTTISSTVTTTDVSNNFDDDDQISLSTVSTDNSSEIIDLTTESNGTQSTTLEAIEVTTVTTEASTEVPTTAIPEPIKVIDYTTELFNKDCLNVHNQFRALHGVEPLKMDNEVSLINLIVFFYFANIKMFSKLYPDH